MSQYQDSPVFSNKDFQEESFSAASKAITNEEATGKPVASSSPTGDNKTNSTVVLDNQNTTSISRIVEVPSLGVKEVSSSLSLEEFFQMHAKEKGKKVEERKDLKKPQYDLHIPYHQSTDFRFGSSYHIRVEENFDKSVLKLKEKVYELQESALNNAAFKDKLNQLEKDKVRLPLFVENDKRRFLSVRLICFF